MTSSVVGRHPNGSCASRRGTVSRGDALAAAAAAPLVGLDDPAGQHRPIRLEPLPGDLEPELVEPAERGQVRAGEAGVRGSVGHVEVFQMGSVRTSILGRPRPLPRHRRAQRLYTLNCEEPHIGATILLRVGVPIPVVSRFLGHSSIGITGRPTVTS